MSLIHSNAFSSLLIPSTAFIYLDLSAAPTFWRTHRLSSAHVCANAPLPSLGLTPFMHTPFMGYSAWCTGAPLSRLDTAIPLPTDALVHLSLHLCTGATPLPTGDTPTPLPQLVY